MNHTLDTVYVPLKITYGLVPLLAGLDEGHRNLIAVRDLTMAVGAYTLGALATLKGLAWLPGAPRAEEASIHAPTAR